MKTKIIKFILSPFEKEIQKRIETEVSDRVNSAMFQLSDFVAHRQLDISVSLANCREIHDSVAHKQLLVSKSLLESQRIEALVREMYYDAEKAQNVKKVKSETHEDLGEQKEIDFKFEVLPSIEDFDLSGLELVPTDKMIIDEVAGCSGCFFENKVSGCPMATGNYDCEPNLIYVKKGGSSNGNS